MNRRKFLLNSGLFTAALTGTCGKLSLAAQHVGAGEPGDDYKALVCIFLQGGNDSFNMLIPADKDRFSEYKSARGSMALELDEFVANVGNLIEPTSIKSVLEGSAKLPSSLFSHNDQRNQWHSGLAKANPSTGWLGRAADRNGKSVTRKSVIR